MIVALWKMNKMFGDYVTDFFLTNMSCKIFPSTCVIPQNIYAFASKLYFWDCRAIYNFNQKYQSTFDSYVVNKWKKSNV